MVAKTGVAIFTKAMTRWSKSMQLIRFQVTETVPHFQREGKKKEKFARGLHEWRRRRSGGHYGRMWTRRNGRRSGHFTASSEHTDYQFAAPARETRHVTGRFVSRNVRTTERPDSGEEPRSRAHAAASTGGGPAPRRAHVRNHLSEHPGETTVEAACRSVSFRGPVH